MKCTHGGQFTCTSNGHGWRWHCLACDEISSAYGSRMDCIEAFTRLSRKLTAQSTARSD